jgi:hypothetical protein
MSSVTRDIDPMTPPPDGFRFRLIHVFYAMAFIGSALAVFDGVGALISLGIVTFWGLVFGIPSRAAAGCCIVIVIACAAVCGDVWLLSNSDHHSGRAEFIPLARHRV